MTRSARTGRPAPALAFLVALALGACTPSQDPTAPTFPFAKGWRGASAGAPVLLANDRWWLRLQDPALNRLVDLALRENLTLVAARHRVERAEAERAAVPGQLSRSGQVEAGFGGADTGPGQRRADAVLGLEWLFDPHGGQRAGRRAAEARLLGAEADRDAARLLVLSSLAEAYLDLRLRQQLLVQRRQELASRRQTLAMVRTMADAEAATRIDMARTSARVAEIEAQLPGAQAAITARINEIAVLAGQQPGQLPLDLRPVVAVPRPGLRPDVGIPADLLRNRPDIRGAEQAYYATLAEVDMARAALYPRLSLSGTISLSALPVATRRAEYFIGPALQLPVSGAATGQATLRARQAAVHEAHAAWTARVLQAVLEVENALIDYRAVSQSLGPAGRAAQLYREARGLTRTVFESGDATLSEMIEAETALAQSETALAELRHRQAQAFVVLNLRLGAGHGAEPGPAGQMPK